MTVERLRASLNDRYRIEREVGQGGMADGKRLYYRSGTSLLAATIMTTPALAVGAREVLFAGPFATDVYHPNYDVTPDGRGFVMVRPVEENRQLVVVLNWSEELRQRAGRAGR